jgi:hypothetical protein
MDAMHASSICWPPAEVDFDDGDAIRSVAARAAPTASRTAFCRLAALPSTADLAAAHAALRTEQNRTEQNRTEQNRTGQRLQQQCGRECWGRR